MGFGLDSNGNIQETVTLQGDLGGGVGDLASKDWVGNYVRPKSFGDSAINFPRSNQWLDMGVTIENGDWYHATLLDLNTEPAGSAFPLTMFAAADLWRSDPVAASDIQRTTITWSTVEALFIPFNHPGDTTTRPPRAGVLAFKRLSTAEPEVFKLAMGWRPELAIGSGGNIATQQAPSHIRIDRVFR